LPSVFCFWRSFYIPTRCVFLIIRSFTSFLFSFLFAFIVMFIHLILSLQIPLFVAIFLFCNSPSLALRLASFFLSILRSAFVFRHPCGVRFVWVWAIVFILSVDLWSVAGDLCPSHPSFIQLFIQLFIYSFIYSFIHLVL
jgi:hypothetical protein